MKEKKNKQYTPTPLQKYFMEMIEIANAANATTYRVSGDRPSYAPDWKVVVTVKRLRRTKKIEVRD